MTQENEQETDSRGGSFRNRRGQSLRKSRETALSSLHEYALHRQATIRRRINSSEQNQEPEETTELMARAPKEQDTEPEPEVIWIRRDDVHPRRGPRPQSLTFEIEEPDYCTSELNHNVKSNNHKSQNKTRSRPKTDLAQKEKRKANHLLNDFKPEVGDISSELFYRKLIVAEWQRVAAVVDRILFWLYLVGTIAAYIVILIVIPKKNYDEKSEAIKELPDVRLESRYTM